MRAQAHKATNSQVPDVRDSARRAILSGTGVDDTEDEVITLSDQGVTIQSRPDSGGVVVGTVVSYDRAFERVVGSTSFVLEQLEASYRQAREQAQGWFRFSLVAALAGFILITFGASLERAIREAK